MGDSAKGSNDFWKKGFFIPKKSLSKPRGEISVSFCFTQIAKNACIFIEFIVHFSVFSF